MKNIFIKSIPLFFVIVLTSCFDYQTQFDGPYSDAGPDGDSKIPKEVVYVAGGNVYLANEFASDSILIENSGEVEIASINNEHSKVLFKKDNNNIQIYDIESGNVAGEVPDSETAIWFDYHKNNQTIYYLLTNDRLYTYGPDVLDNQPLNLRTLSGIAGKIKGVALTEAGTIIFSIVSTTTNNKYLIISDGTDVIDFFQSSYARINFRLNASEDRLWSGNDINSLLYQYRLPIFNQLSTSPFYIMGAPVAQDIGYRVTDDNTIVTPISTVIQSPGGQITSIDY